MTYEKLTNSLMSYFKNGEYNGWILTDDDCLQAYKELHDEHGDCYGYRFIMLTEDSTDKDHCFFSEEIYVCDEYTADDLWLCGKSYYEDRQTFDSLPRYVKFECLFETMGRAMPYKCSDAFGWYLDDLNF